MLRSGALADRRVIDLVTHDFVPVWINVRTTALPRRAWVPDVLVNARVGADNMIIDPFSEGFFVRSVVLTPDGETILNPNPKTSAASLAKILRDGDNLYATVDAPDYLVMLRRALGRLHDRSSRN